MQVNSIKFVNDNQVFMNSFGRKKMCVWLPVAIKHYGRTGDIPFLINVDETATEQSLHTEPANGDETVIITTKRPLEMLPLFFLGDILLEFKRHIKQHDDDRDVEMADATLSEVSTDNSRAEFVTVTCTRTRAESLEKGRLAYTS
jgi:hypothetical protein